MENETHAPVYELTPKELRHFFLSHLNRIYCAKSELVEKLPELGKRSNFVDLRQAVLDTIEIVRNQILRIREIYISMDAIYTPESCVGLIGLLDEAFQAIGSPDDSPAMRDLSVLFYMQNIESIETASFNMMLRVAHQLDEKHVAELLFECYEEAKEDKILFREITGNYIH